MIRFQFLNRLNNLYINAVQTISKYSIVTLILLTVAIEFSVSIIFSLWLFPNHSAGPTFDSKKEEFLFVVILAPLIETLIFQYSIITSLLEKRPKAYLFACIFSAILFGLSHFYSPVYILKTFFSGLLFATLYLVVSQKKRNAFIAVVIAHALYNLTVFCGRLFF
ncbi:MAG: hypothetical protein CUR34_00520 [Sediminibacterium sp.]|nr:MAG: hypothetical protein CUR34_00520 [Sediminibacterium sp.] [Sediminibacterium sp. FEMGT703S]